MRRPVFLAVALLAGCTTVADLREGEPFIESSSAKSAEAFAACLADQWTARSGNVSTAPLSDGTRLTLTYAIYSNTVAAVTAEARNTAGGSAITVYARKGDRSDKLRREIAACA